MPTTPKYISKFTGPEIDAGITKAQTDISASVDAAALSAQEAAGSASDADTSRTQAELAATAAGAPLVTSLTSPVPAEGEIELLQTEPGVQVYEVQTGAWVFIGWLGNVEFKTFTAFIASPSTFADDIIVKVSDGGFAYKATSATGNLGQTNAGGQEFDVIFKSGGVSVEAFGAKGDNSTDDSTAINNAIDAMARFGDAVVPAGPDGGTVLLGAKQYKVNSSIVLKDRVKLQGLGERVTYIRGESIASGAVITSSSLSGTSINAYVDLADFTVLGPGKASGVDGIHFNAWASSIVGVQVKDARRLIYLGSDDSTVNIVETTIERCKLHEGQHGIYPARPSGVSITDIRISNNTINACDVACMEIRNSGGYQIWGNNLYNAPNLIKISPIINNTAIFGNYFGECTETPLFLNAGSGSNSTTLSVVGNNFKRANQDATAANDYDKALITLFNGGADGDFDNIVVMGNVVRDATGNAKHGIYLFGTLNSLQIGPNTWGTSFTGTTIRFPGGDTSAISVTEPSLRYGLNLSGAWIENHVPEKYYGTAVPTIAASNGDTARNNALGDGETIEWVYDGTRWLQSSAVKPRSQSTTTMENVAANINTTGKFPGKPVHNNTDGNLYYATGTAASDTWITYDGASTLTPV